MPIYISLQGFKFISKGVRRVAGRIRVSYNQRERLSSALRGTGLGRRVMKRGRNQVNCCFLEVWLGMHMFRLPIVLVQFVKSHIDTVVFLLEADSDLNSLDNKTSLCPLPHVFADPMSTR